MNDTSLTLPAGHLPSRPIPGPIPGAASLVATARSASIYLAFVSSVGFTLAVVCGMLN